MRRDYRLLKPGEPLQYGDEILYYWPKNGPIPVWGPVRKNGKEIMQENIFTFARRPATGPAAAGQMIEVLEAEIAFLRKLLAQKESA